MYKDNFYSRVLLVDCWTFSLGYFTGYRGVPRLCVLRVPAANTVHPVDGLHDKRRDPVQTGTAGRPEKRTPGHSGVPARHKQDHFRSAGADKPDRRPRG